MEKLCTVLKVSLAFSNNPQQTDAQPSLPWLLLIFGSLLARLSLPLFIPNDPNAKLRIT
jgi:hypothetical protein